MVGKSIVLVLYMAGVAGMPGVAGSPATVGRTVPEKYNYSIFIRQLLWRNISWLVFLPTTEVITILSHFLAYAPIAQKIAFREIIENAGAPILYTLQLIFE